MSLRFFHVIFIICSIIVTLGFAFWAIAASVSLHSAGYGLLGGGAVLFGAVLVYYAVNVFGKLKKIDK